MLVASSDSSPLYRFLLGSWVQRKRIEYSSGGSFGSWHGKAQFKAVEAMKEDTPWHLIFTEEGDLTLDGSAVSYPSHGRPLVFDCVQPCVYFLEDALRVDGSLSTKSLRRFHDLPFTRPIPTFGCPSEASCSFDHMCVKDFYTGRMVLHDWRSFSIYWHVEGPQKLGDVTQTFEREDE